MPSLLQAAHGLGAPPPAVFGLIFLPLSLPGVYAGTMIVFVLSLGFYITPDLLGGSSNQVYAVLLAKAVRLNSTRPGLPAAMSTLLLLVTLVVLAVCARLVSVNDLWVAETRQQVWRRRRTGRDGAGRRQRIPEGAVVEFLLGVGKLPYWLHALPGTLLAGVAIAVSIVPILVALVFSFARSIFLPFPPTELALKWYYAFASSTRWFDAIYTSITLGLTVALTVTPDLRPHRGSSGTRSFPRQAVGHNSRVVAAHHSAPGAGGGSLASVSSS